MCDYALFSPEYSYIHTHEQMFPITSVTDDVTWSVMNGDKSKPRGSNITFFSIGSVTRLILVGSMSLLLLYEIFTMEYINGPI